MWQIGRLKTSQCYLFTLFWATCYLSSQLQFGIKFSEDPFSFWHVCAKVLPYLSGSAFPYQYSLFGTECFSHPVEFLFLVFRTKKVKLQIPHIVKYWATFYVATLLEICIMLTTETVLMCHDMVRLCPNWLCLFSKVQFN